MTLRRSGRAFALAALLSLTGFAAQAISLEQIRRYVGPKVRLLGFIGYGILRDYEVVIDYPRRRVTCYSLHTATPTRRPFVRQDSLAFTLVRGWPIMTGYIGQVPVQLLGDTGSVNDDLESTFCQKLPLAGRPVFHGADFTTGAKATANARVSDSCRAWC